MFGVRGVFARWISFVLASVSLLASITFSLPYIVHPLGDGRSKGLSSSKWIQALIPTGRIPKQQNFTVKTHPIDVLIEDAEKRFAAIIELQSHDLNTAAARYRSRRGRHPPPGFDNWWQFAQEKNATIVEEFFDQIYNDLNPFWAFPASVVRKEGSSSDNMRIRIENGKATTESDFFWMQIWVDMLQSIEQYLPDLEISLNTMDEPRIVVPWEEVTQYVEVERQTRNLTDPKTTKTTFSFRDWQEDNDAVPITDKAWQRTGPYWRVAARGCPPGSPAHTAEVLTVYSRPPSISMAMAKAHTFKGYVSNYTLSTDICHQPDLQSLHGALIEPVTVSESRVLFPLFGGSKMAVNNEILLPAAMYWKPEDRFFTGENIQMSWTTKVSKVVWRGVASGGRPGADNWVGFHRHRLISMTNSTKVAQAESWEHLPENWAVPHSYYDIAAWNEGHLADWIESWTDTGFTDYACDECSFFEPYYALLPTQSMQWQFENKFLPDIDGNSFSGRYRAFLMSSSLPIKATIFKEWHDSRLIAWKHFVPMDNRFLDFYGIMEYFLGYEGAEIKVEGHDEQARQIATAGQDWANQVLRKEDMQLYTWRLLLEYARICDDDRENMGFVADLL